MNPIEFCRTIAEELNVKKVTFLMCKADDKRLDVTFTLADGTLDLYLDGERCHNEDLALSMMKSLSQSMGSRLQEAF